MAGGPKYVRLHRQQMFLGAPTIRCFCSQLAATLPQGTPQNLAASTVAEAQIENLGVAKGYTDCVAFISEGGVSVVVSNGGGELEEADVAKIVEIVTGETGVPAAQVKIIRAQG